MTANIILLKNYRSTVRDSTNGVIFPQVYRVIGNYYDLDENGQGVQSNRAAKPCYTLSETDTGGLSDTKTESIEKFEEGIDIGWLYIRHHVKDDFMNGYLDALMDNDGEESRTSHAVFQTPKGLFTLYHRAATKECPDNLLIYVTKVISPHGITDSYTIVHPDGTITRDGDILLREW